MPIRTYTDLPIGDRAGFELTCARHGLAPLHFEISGEPDPDNPSSEQGLVLVRRGRWAQAYRVDSRGQWLREFESDLNARFFR